MTKNNESKNHSSQKDKVLNEQEIEKRGFLKGSISVLNKEKEELQRIVGIVEQLIQMNMKELANMGVDITDLKGDEKEITKPKKPIEDLL